MHFSFSRFQSLMDRICGRVHQVKTNDAPPSIQSPENNVPPPFLHLVSVLAAAAELLHTAHLRPALLAPINYWQAL